MKNSPFFTGRLERENISAAEAGSAHTLENPPSTNSQKEAAPKSKSNPDILLIHTIQLNDKCIFSSMMAPRANESLPSNGSIQESALKRILPNRFPNLH